MRSSDNFIFPLRLAIVMSLEESSLFKWWINKSDRGKIQG